jgi:hypothetical protein
MYLSALVFTILGWALQLYETLIKKTRNISIFLPMAYVIATALFGASSLLSGDVLAASLDWLTSILALVVFIVLVTRKKAA